jgi:hypothetical protein
MTTATRTPHSARRSPGSAFFIRALTQLSPVKSTSDANPTACYLHTATLLTNGQVLVAGGCDETNPLVRAEVYNPATATWASLVSMSKARYGHTASLLIDGRVLTRASEHLRKLVTNRPKRKKTLISHLRARFDKTATDAAMLDLVARLEKTGRLTISEKEAVTYHD